jgi:RHS repeat-associated protein
MTQSTGGTTTTYTYNAADELTQSGVGGTTTQYSDDADGNQTGNGTAAFAYDAADHLVGATIGGATAAFTLDDRGDRVATTVNGAAGGTKVWDINSDLPQLAIQADGGAAVGDYHMNPLGIPQALHTSAGNAYLTHDWLGSVTDVTDLNSTPQLQYAYTAFGTQTTGAVGSVNIANPFGFTGQVNDPTIPGQLDLRARTYDPTTGRFTGRDAIDLRIDDPYIAAYDYANESPTRFTDPSGNDPIADCFRQFDVNGLTIDEANLDPKPGEPPYTNAAHDISTLPKDIAGYGLAYAAKWGINWKLEVSLLAQERVAGEGDNFLQFNFTWGIKGFAAPLAPVLGITYQTSQGVMHVKPQSAMDTIFPAAGLTTKLSKDELTAVLATNIEFNVATGTLLLGELKHLWRFSDKAAYLAYAATPEERQKLQMSHNPQLKCEGGVVCDPVRRETSGILSRRSARYDAYQQYLAPYTDGIPSTSDPSLPQTHLF